MVSKCMNTCLRIMGLEYRRTHAPLMHNNLWELPYKTVTYYNKMLFLMEDAMSRARNCLLISELDLHQSCVTIIFLHDS